MQSCERHDWTHPLDVGETPPSCLPLHVQAAAPSGHYYPLRPWLPPKFFRSSLKGGMSYCHPCVPPALTRKALEGVSYYCPSFRGRGGGGPEMWGGRPSDRPPRANHDDPPRPKLTQLPGMYPRNPQRSPDPGPVRHALPVLASDSSVLCRPCLLPTFCHGPDGTRQAGDHRDLPSCEVARAGPFPSLAKCTYRHFRTFSANGG